MSIDGRPFEEITIAGASTTREPGRPALPVIGLLPYPTRYRIYFGKPILLEGDANDEDEAILQKVAAVKATLQGMIDEGLAARQHVFW